MARDGYTDEGDSDVQYVVLVDVVGSRDIDDRNVFESRLEGALEYVNESESESISTPFTRMKGIDEFGCVLTDISPVPDAMSAILDRIHPTHARFAVATGDIDVGVDSGTVAQMDGPAFHRASAILDGLEDDGLYVGIDTNQRADGLLEGALNLLLIEREDLTERQVEVILSYEKHGTQSLAGEELGLGQQAVSDTLRRANYGRRMEIRRGLRRALEDVYE